MPRVPITTINLLNEYQIPENDAHQFICSYCRYCANRSRNRWIQHMYDIHPSELNSVLDGIRAVNRAIQQIHDNDNNNEIENANAFNLLEENELIEEQQDNGNKIDQEIKGLLQSFKNGILNEPQCLHELKKLFEKKN